MSGKRPKGTFQDRYNKPDSAIPPFNEGLFYRVLWVSQLVYFKLRNKKYKKKKPNY